MSVKHIWWSYARGMVRAYPERCQQYEDLIEQRRTPILDGTPGAKSRGDPVGNLLGQAEQTATYKEYWAVRKALEVCSTRNADLLEFVKLYYWRKPGLSLEAVAYRLNYSPETIRKWNHKLIYNVAYYRGLLDENRPVNGQKGHNQWKTSQE